MSISKPTALEKKLTKINKQIKELSDKTERKVSFDRVKGTVHGYLPPLDMDFNKRYLEKLYKEKNDILIHIILMVQY